MTYLKFISFVFSLMVIGSSKAFALKASAGLPLPMASGESFSLTDIQEGLAIGDGLLLVGFLLWIAYIIFCMPDGILKKR